MARTWTTEVGHSTRALAREDPETGAAAALRAGGNIVELSAFDESTLDAVAGALGRVRRKFRRTSVHAPVAAGRLSEPELVARLAGLDLPVVVHPGMIVTPPVWQPLGEHLLVENNDGRKPSGSTPEALAMIFAALPEARFCLDVSHALHVGGQPLVQALATTFRGRLAELHAGCGCGTGPDEHLDPDVLLAVSRAVAVAGHSLPVIVERPAGTSAEALAQVYDVRGAVVAGVAALEAA